MGVRRTAETVGLVAYHFQRRSPALYGMAAVVILSLVTVGVIGDWVLPVRPLWISAAVAGLLAYIAGPVVATLSTTTVFMDVIAPAFDRDSMSGTNHRLMATPKFSLSSMHTLVVLMSIVLVGSISVDILQLSKIDLIARMSLNDAIVMSALATVITEVRPGALFVPRMIARAMTGRLSKTGPASVVEDDTIRNRLGPALSLTRQIYLTVFGSVCALMAWSTLQSAYEILPAIVALTCVWFAAAANTFVQMLHEAESAPGET